METKKEYIAPELTVVEFKSERGYASSGPDVLQVLNSLLGQISSSNIEGWEYNENNESFNNNDFNWE